MLGGRDEIGEGVFLVRKLAFAVPAPAFFRAAADMRDREDESAVDQERRFALKEAGMEMP